MTLLQLIRRSPLLTGTLKLSVFLVGICLKEYETCTYFTTRRGFQHIVGTCEPKSRASFDTLISACNETLEVSFLNSSSVESEAICMPF